MAIVMGSQTITLTSGSSAQSLLGSSDLPAKLVVRTSDTGVFIGDSAVKSSLPTSGYELVPDKEYEFDLSAFVGSSTDRNVYVCTNNGGTVTVSYIVTSR